MAQPLIANGVVALCCNYWQLVPPRRSIHRVCLAIRNLTGPPR